MPYTPVEQVTSSGGWGYPTRGKEVCCGPDSRVLARIKPALDIRMLSRLVRARSELEAAGHFL